MLKSTTLIILLLSLGVAVQAAPRLGAEHGLKGAEMKSCDRAGRLCVTVKSESTVGSQLQNLHMLTEPVVTIENRRTGRKETIHGRTGYIDLEFNQLVVYWKKNGKEKETSIHLTTFERMERNR
ncbi:MAG: hypothetical protein KF802_06650 [Bdellovibrionaceae bacterium]|nr:hypothetical protein [Pseudobdellovibrionaceae bacterium]MBX3034414.1 hypothetical protein [Pseudobdellovibrionaceae bacterium]